MNNKRRQSVRDAISKIETLVQNILNEEQEAFDNMPESLQSSENGMISEDAQESLEATIDALEEAISCLEEI